MLGCSVFDDDFYRVISSASHVMTTTGSTVIQHVPSGPHIELKTAAHKRKLPDTIRFDETTNELQVRYYAIGIRAPACVVSLKLMSSLLALHNSVFCPVLRGFCHEEPGIASGANQMAPYSSIYQIRSRYAVHSSPFPTRQIQNSQIWSPKPTINSNL